MIENNFLYVNYCVVGYFFLGRFLKVENAAMNTDPNKILVKATHLCPAYWNYLIFFCYLFSIVNTSYLSFECSDVYQIVSHCSNHE